MNFDKQSLDEIKVCKILPEQIELANQLAKKRKQKEQVKRWKTCAFKWLAVLIPSLIALLAWLFPRTNTIPSEEAHINDVGSNYEEPEISIRENEFPQKVPAPEIAPD